LISNEKVKAGNIHESLKLLRKTRGWYCNTVTQEPIVVGAEYLVVRPMLPFLVIILIMLFSLIKFNSITSHRLGKYGAFLQVQNIMPFTVSQNLKGLPLADYDTKVGS
jgi:hypothetical protein